MRLLIIMTTKFEISGITNNVMNYYRYLDKSDMNIDFVAPNIVPDRIKTEIATNGGSIYELTIRNKHQFRYMFKLIEIIRKGKYDIVHAHGNSCTLALEMTAARLAGTRIRISHSRNTQCQHLFFHRILRPIFNMNYTHGFACGVDAGKWLFKKNDFTVIKNGNDVKKFIFNKEVREIYRDQYKIKDKKVIGHVGLFNYQKNHDYLIDVFYELCKIDKNVVLMLIGDGELREEIQVKTKQLGISEKVIFVGQSLEVNKLIQAMDVMVFPSRYEGLPNVVVEWQIAGLPSLISDKITQEVKITENVNFASIDLEPINWAMIIKNIEITDREVTKNNLIKEISDAGYNIEENAKDLKSIYENILRA